MGIDWRLLETLSSWSLVAGCWKKIVTGRWLLAAGKKRWGFCVRWMGIGSRLPGRIGCWSLVTGYWQKNSGNFALSEWMLIAGYWEHLVTGYWALAAGNR